MSVVSFRQAIQNELTKDLDVDVEAGLPLFDRSEDRSIGYVWVDRVAQDSRIAGQEQIVLYARIYLQWKQQEGTHRPVDAFEGLIEQIQLSLSDIQTSAGPWLFFIDELVPDYENMHVTASITGTTSNLFSPDA